MALSSRVKSFPLVLALIAGAYVSIANADYDGNVFNPTTGGSGERREDFRTLNGRAPLVIAHRGASGYFPEETIEAYRLAIAMGVDVIEPDIVVSKDGVLVARHDVTLNTSTDIASHPEFAARKRAGENGDGEPVAADWFVCDFTLAELKTLGAKSPNHPAAQVYNGQFRIVTFQEILDLIKLKTAEAGYVVAIYPETKNPSYHLNLWKNGQIPARMEDTLMALINANGLNHRDAPIFVQSFEPSSLQYMRSIGSKVKQVQLIDAYDVDFATGKMIYGTDAAHLVYSQPTDWKLAGRKELFDSMLTHSGLAQIKTYADGIGPWKPQVMALTVVPFKAGSGLADVNTVAPTQLIADAHKAGLFVHVYTFRNEQKYLAGFYKGDPTAEYLTFFRAGVDGVFTDFANTGFAARTAYLKETGR